MIDNDRPQPTSWRHPGPSLAKNGVGLSHTHGRKRPRNDVRLRAKRERVCTAKPRPFRICASPKNPWPILFVLLHKDFSPVIWNLEGEGGAGQADFLLSRPYRSLYPHVRWVAGGRKLTGPGAGRGAAASFPNSVATSTEQRNVYQISLIYDVPIPNGHHHHPLLQFHNSFATFTPLQKKTTKKKRMGDKVSVLSPKEGSEDVRVQPRQPWSPPFVHAT
jgi:hypothetical protein